MPRAYGHRLAAYIPLFSKIPRLSVFSGRITHKYPTPTTYTQPWSGPVDDVNWRVAPVYFVLFSTFVRAWFKEESEGQYLFTILYRISLFPFRFAIVSIFTFFFLKK